MPVATSRHDPHPAIPGGEPRVLLVDDDIDVCEIVAMKLQAAGHVVDVVHRGDAALEALRARPYAVAILDWMMPGMSGLDLCTAIRDELGPSIKLVMLSAKAQAADLAAAESAGIDEYIVKPFSPRHLAERIAVLTGTPS